MPKKRKVPTLVELTFPLIAKHFVTCGNNLINSESEILEMDCEMGMARLTPTLQSMKHHLSTNVPRDLYDRMATESLKAIKNMIGFSVSVINLVRVVLDDNLRSMKFQYWPEIMQIELFHNLHCMTGLEVLDLGSDLAGSGIFDIEKITMNGVSAMPKLVSFTLRFRCTDNIIVAVVQNCSKLRYLNVMGSRSVTDRSVVALLKNRELRSIQFFRTSVTIAGYANLLLGHPHLEDIGRCDNIVDVLGHIREETNNSDNRYRLRFIVSHKAAITDHLYLLTNSCPYTTRLSLMCDKRTIDLTVLAALKNLNELKLMSCYFYANHLKTLLYLTNCRITDLHLEEVDEFDQSALIHIGQTCPDLRNLTVRSSIERFDHTTMNSCKSPVKPFAQLENIQWIANCGRWHLEYLLSHCVNVKFLQLDKWNPLNDEIDDAMMKRIFTLNPMTKLEEFDISPRYGNDTLTMSTVQLVMENCKNLRKLMSLGNWIKIPVMEFECFIEQLRVNNIYLATWKEYE